MSRTAMADKIRARQGFIAALDQSGGSAPKALRLYGIAESAYGTEAEMYDLIHAMRTRIVTAPAFTGDKVAGAILFEQTMEREFAGKPTAQYLWQERGVVPFVKIDQGLADAADDVQLMKPLTNLDSLLERAVSHGIFGTKMRSVIHAANTGAIQSVVDQQYDVALQVLAKGLVPIIEPEVTISIPDKAESEMLLKDALLTALTRVPDDQQVMFKLTLPETANLYKPLVDHPQCLGVVALSGGYSRDEANKRLSQNTGVVASFSRALTEGLSVDQEDSSFNTLLASTITSIYAASVSG